MSGPLASTIAAQSGVAQTVIAPQAPDKKEAKKKAEQEEAKKGEKAEQGEQARPGSGLHGFPEEKVKVRRKRVKLRDAAERRVESFSQATAKENQKSAKAQAQAKATKTQEAYTAPTKDTGYNKAVNRLMQQGLLTQSSVKFEQRKQELNNSPGSMLSPKGQQRWMVNNLISMITISVDQHTGGKAGEAYESRRDNRMVLMALRGLRDGEKQETPSTSRGISKGELSLKQRQASSLLSCIVGPTRLEDQPALSEVA